MKWFLWIPKDLCRVRILPTVRNPIVKAMTTSESQIRVGAIIRRRAQTGKAVLTPKYELVMRWLLGDGANEQLPNPQDEFRLSVSVCIPDRLTGQYQCTAILDSQKITPRLYTMIDPPREDKLISGHYQSLDEDQRVYSSIATYPTKPVDPDDVSNGKLRRRDADGIYKSYPMGIIHLLHESSPFVEHERLADVLKSALLAAYEDFIKINDAKPQELHPGIDYSDEVIVLASAIAKFIIENKTRPRFLPRLFLDYAKEVQSQLLGNSPDLSKISQIFVGLRPSKALVALNTNLVLSVMTNKVLIDKLDTIHSELRRARQHLILRSIQGGNLIDFWGTDRISKETELPADAEAESETSSIAGSVYPASELLGLGYTIPLEEATVREWNDTLNTKVVVTVEATINPAKTAYLDHLSTKPEYRFSRGYHYEVQEGSYTLTNLPIGIEKKREHFKMALETGSSHPIVPPLTAFINYSLSQSNAGRESSSGKIDPSFNEDTTTFKTGESRIQFYIAPPKYEPEYEFNSTATSYNLYGVWEGSEDPDFPLEVFDDNSKDDPLDVKLSQLKKWRISSRYSPFKDLLGSLHSEGGDKTVLDKILKDPPWFPILLKPASGFYESQDSDEESHIRSVPLPTVGELNYTSASIDLRRGMITESKDFSIRWDNQGLIYSEWNPYSLRGKDTPTSNSRPQRYRFWITSVDQYEQESFPIAVEANDPDAGEPLSYLFEPKFRTPLGPPQLLDDPCRSITSDIDRVTGSGKIVLKWETPFAAPISSSVPNPNERIDKTVIRARLIICRKRLSKDSPRLTSVSGPAWKDEPHWRSALSSLSGFEEYHIAENICPPSEPGNHLWEYKCPLINGHIDLDYEYVAHISFVIADKTNFWFPNLDGPSSPFAKSEGRRLTGKSLDQYGEYNDVATYISEYPQSSDISTTQIIQLPSIFPTRGVQLPGIKFFKADIIPVPPRLSRDQILQRLLSSRNRSVVVWPPEIPEWLIELFKDLTYAQYLLITTAIRRISSIGLPGQYDPSMRFAWKYLIEMFSNPSTYPSNSDIDYSLNPNPMPRSHPLIGFRGIVQLSWNYIPLATAISLPKPLSPESECAKFLLYQVRIPLLLSEAIVYSSYQASECTLQNEFPISLNPTNGNSFLYICSIPSDQQDKLANIKIPCGVCVVPSSLTDDPYTFQEKDIFRLVETRRLDNMNNSAFILHTSIDNLSPPNTANLLFYSGILVNDNIPNVCLNSEKQCAVSLNVPVGGGQLEYYLWWIVSESFTGLKSSALMSAFYIWKAFYSTEPPPLTIVADSAFQRSDFPKDPSQVIDFLPAIISNNPEPKVLLANFPRVLISWTPPPSISSSSQDARIVISRRVVPISENEQLPKNLFMSDATASWEILKLIANLPLDSQLEQSWLEIIKPWLLGQDVIPGDDIPTTPEAEFLTVDAPPLSIELGMGILQRRDASGNLVNMPTFFDYFQLNELNQLNTALPMNGSFQYSYRAELWLEATPSALAKSGKIYLRSRPTEWTAFVRPVSPPPTLQPQNPQYTLLVPPSRRPQVIFKFSVKVPESLNLSSRSVTDTPTTWLFRILVRRLIPVEKGLPSSRQSDFLGQWIDVGAPLTLGYNILDNSGTISDDLIDRDFPDRAYTLYYQFSLSQYALISRARKTTSSILRKGNLEERLVRNGDIFPKVLKDPDDPESPLVPSELPVTIDPMIISPETNDILNELHVYQEIVIF